MKTRDITPKFKLNLNSVSRNNHNHSITSDMKTYFDSIKNNAILKQTNYFKELYNNQYLKNNERDISNFIRTTRITNSQSNRDQTFSNSNNSKPSKRLN